MKQTHPVTLLAIVVIAGCAGETAAEPVAETWQTLLTTDWTLASGSEEFLCMRKTLEEDALVTAFEAIASTGTHHTVLSVGEPSGPDGVSPCPGSEGNAARIFGTGVGTDAFTFPPGIGVVLHGGEQLLLNLHIYNTGAEAISGTSGIRALSSAPVDGLIEADGTLMGTVAIDIPAGSHTVVEGGCLIDEEATVFAVLPHMHTLGTHIRVIAESEAAGTVSFFDGDYTFETQRYYRTDEVKLSPGDRVRVECTYDNPSDHDVRFGDGTDDEMCFAGVMRYPATGEDLCVNL
jgi:copper type II ascorbate-dependent monooxygenase-like protein